MTNFVGTAGNDTFAGAAGDDTFHLEDGGHDTATGAGGMDIFYMGGALEAGDRLNGGGSDQDRVVLDGDYSAGLTLGASLNGIEIMQLAGGHSYDISDFADAVGLKFLLAGSALGPSDHMIIDASDAPDAMNIWGGQGDDTIIGTAGDDIILDSGGENLFHGGDGDDGFDLQSGGRIFGDGGDDVFQIERTYDGTGALFNGGAGSDTLLVTGDVTLEDQSLHSVESVAMRSGSIQFADGNVRAGGKLTIHVDGPSGLHFTVDGSLETDGRYIVDAFGARGGCGIIGGAQADKITGSGSNDTIQGADGDDHIVNPLGNDLLQGGDGDDLIYSGDGVGLSTLKGSTIDGGLGGDTLSGAAKQDVFLYHSTADSTVHNPDSITKLSPRDLVDLSAIDADTTAAGDQAFVWVSGFGGHAGELMTSFDSGSNITSIEGDVDGDGTADFLILVHGSGLGHFAL